jgi:hypothetical protein
MSLSGVIFPTGEYNVTRTTAGTYDENGLYVPGDETELTIVADIQAVSGQDLQNLREGQRATDVRVVYTNAALIALDEVNGIVGDLVEHDGEIWRVFKVQRFRVFADRWRAYMERINRAAPVET